MIRRDGIARMVILTWATFQLLAPGATAFAHGLSSMELSGAPAVHVEATGGAACPEVHSPDCGICRYLSGCGERNPGQHVLPASARQGSAEIERNAAFASASADFPPGRAPPEL